MVTSASSPRRRQEEIPRRSSTLQSDMTRIERMAAANSNEEKFFESAFRIDPSAGPNFAPCTAASCFSNSALR